ncbi:ABC transporter family substrate-binding protein [Planotetraspora kaengkrachanensis]|uniref:ABC transporter substrate-binding protein n=1 Tax=Planotetraspora kaengkrachanensis TaxID=575193 RepID=A0A8J3M6X7_9ACTN|nr:ABC transporter family substrate-binding protein [Planotetraspora kaengkrachanensis]GIG80649.1 ABC transporter substrate-binding protein [Planotetraspora kaengkrachanensis]
MRARWPAALAALIALGSVSACGGENLPGWRGSSLAPSPVKAIDVNPMPREKVKDGGTLKWGLGDFPVQWNQNHIDGDITSVDTVMSALMPTPFRSDERGQVTLDLDYVTNARVTATTPRQVITYTLNPKAKWSDGRPITWADYAAQWKAMNGQNKAFRVDSTIAYENIQSVARGTSDHEVVVTLTQPFNEWQSLFSPLYPSSSNATPEAFNSDWVNKIPVTAGPFKLSSFDGKNKTITLDRDDNWWGDKAKLDKIVFKGVKADMVRAFTKGEVDVFDVGASPEEYSRARGAWDAVVRQAAGTDFRQFTFNGESPTLSDIRVRRAMAMALDRRALMQLDLKGLGWPAVTLDNHFLANSQQGYRGNAGDLGAYNPQRAGQLLDEAGWKLSGKTRAKNGTPLNLRFVVPAGVGVSDTEAEVTRLMLRRIGVGVTIQTVPFNDFFTKYLIPGNFDLTAFSYPATPFPISNAFDVYANGEAAKGDDMKWYSNLGRTGSHEIDQAMYRAGSVLDPEEAAESVNSADQLVWQEVNVIPLYQTPQNVAVRSTLANIGANGFYDLKYADIGFTS